MKTTQEALRIAAPQGDRYAALSNAGRDHYSFVSTLLHSFFSCPPTTPPLQPLPPPRRRLDSWESITADLPPLAARSDLRYEAAARTRLRSGPNGAAWRTRLQGSGAVLGPSAARL